MISSAQFGREPSPQGICIAELCISRLHSSNLAEAGHGQQIAIQLRTPYRARLATMSEASNASQHFDMLCSAACSFMLPKVAEHGLVELWNRAAPIITDSKALAQLSEATGISSTALWNVVHCLGHVSCQADCPSCLATLTPQCDAL